MKSVKLFVSVKTNAREERVEALDATHFQVAVKALPVEGKANLAVIRLLSAHLGVPSSRLTLRSGASGRRKVLDLA